MLEVELSHNTCVKNLVVNNVLFDALVSKFFTLYGESFYGLHYQWVEDGSKVLEENTILRDM